jgi:hypothetical protein
LRQTQLANYAKSIIPEPIATFAQIMLLINDQ